MLVTLTCVFVPIASIATLLRFVARFCKHAPLGLDDAFAVAALLTFCAFMAVLLWGMVFLIVLLSF